MTEPTIPSCKTEIKLTGYALVESTEIRAAIGAENFVIPEACRGCASPFMEKDCKLAPMCTSAHSQGELGRTMHRLRKIGLWSKFGLHI